VQTEARRLLIPHFYQFKEVLTTEQWLNCLSGFWAGCHNGETMRFAASDARESGEPIASIACPQTAPVTLGKFVVDGLADDHIARANQAPGQIIYEEIDE